MSLWLCIRLPQLPIECFGSDGVPLFYEGFCEGFCEESREGPAVVIEKQRVIACNDAATDLGVLAGQSASTVRALIDDDGLILHEREEGREQRCLERLQLWAYSLTPVVQDWYGNCLQLEIGSCLRLHGSIDALFEKARFALNQRGFSTAFGLAETRQAAWLLSHSSNGDATDISKALTERLAPLPICLMNLVPVESLSPSVTRLEKAGIEYFQDLLALPTAALRRRCGDRFGDWITAATATSDAVTQVFSPPANFRDALWFGFEIRHTEELHPAMRQLLDMLCQFLRMTQLATDCIHWQLLRAKGEPHRFEIRASSAGHQADQWFELSCLKLDQLTISDNVEGIALETDQLAPLAPVEAELFTTQQGSEPLHALLDRLRNRLGLRAVTQLALREAHLPEHSQQHTETSPSDTAPETHLAQRPFWLMSEPQPIHQQQGQLHWNGPLEILHGPERIEDNWWQRPVSRDYYIARSADGQPLWLFQDRHSRCWFVQGVLP